MVIKSIQSIPPDERMSCKYSSNITPRNMKVVGHLYLNPSLRCKNECYVGMDLVTESKSIILIYFLAVCILHFRC